jgi:hypothetical protein
MVLLNICVLDEYNEKHIMCVCVCACVMESHACVIEEFGSKKLGHMVTFIARLKLIGEVIKSGYILGNTTLLGWYMLPMSYVIFESSATLGASHDNLLIGLSCQNNICVKCSIANRSSLNSFPVVCVSKN